jgi:hypothetical protein
MSFRITGLPANAFSHLFGLSDEELATRGVRRVVADRKPGFPDRIELRDAEVGERLLLLNYEHQSAATPYRASHAIFVLEGAQDSYDHPGRVPALFRSRLLSLRGFDAEHMMVEADVFEGVELERGIARLFGNPAVAYIHAHYAKPGCYAARIDRVR